MRLTRTTTTRYRPPIELGTSGPLPFSHSGGVYKISVTSEGDNQRYRYNLELTAEDIRKLATFCEKIEG